MEVTAMLNKISQFDTRRAHIPTLYREDDHPGEGYGILEHPRERAIKLNAIAKQVPRLEANGYDPASISAQQADSILSPNSQMLTRNHKSSNNKRARRKRKPHSRSSQNRNAKVLTAFPNV